MPETQEGLSFFAKVEKSPSALFACPLDGTIGKAFLSVPLTPIRITIRPQLASLRSENLLREVYQGLTLICVASKALHQYDFGLHDALAY